MGSWSGSSRRESHRVTEGIHLRAFETDAGLHVQLSEVDGVHRIAGSDALDGVEDVGIGISGGLGPIHISAEVRQNVALRLIEVRYGPELPAEIIAAEVVSIVLEAALERAHQNAGVSAFLVDQPS